MEKITKEFKTRKEIAVELGISERTLYRMIKEADLDIQERRLISYGDYQKLKEILLKI